MLRFTEDAHQSFSIIPFGHEIASLSSPFSINPMHYTQFFLLFSLCLLIACEPSNSGQETSTVDNTSKPMDTLSKEQTKPTLLADQLNTKKTAFLERADTKKINAYEKGIQDVAQSGVLEKALKVGDKAPDFQLNNATQQSINLYKQLENGPVVLTWYRGGWCPYCNITLHFLQEKLPAFKEHNAQLLALTPEQPDKSLDTKEKNSLEFEVLSDLDNQVARKFGVVYTLPEEIHNAYENGFGLSDYNGNEKGELPLAATYVIDTSGIIRYAFLDADYRNRAEPEEIVRALAEL